MQKDYCCEEIAPRTTNMILESWCGFGFYSGFEVVPVILPFEG